MNEINTLDLKSLAANAVRAVFDTMLSLEIEINDAEAAKNLNGNRIVASVSFAGDVMGNLTIHVNDSFALLITASILGMEIDEIDGEEEVHDVIGELSNMVGGSEVATV